MDRHRLHVLPSADRPPFDLRFFSLWELLRNLNAEKASRVPVYTFNALKDRYVQPQIAVIPISTVRRLQKIPYPYRSKIPSNINTPNTKITLQSKIFWTSRLFLNHESKLGRNSTTSPIPQIINSITLFPFILVVFLLFGILHPSLLSGSLRDPHMKSKFHPI